MEEIFEKEITELNKTFQKFIETNKDIVATPRVSTEAVILINNKHFIKKSLNNFVFDNFKTKSSVQKKKKKWIPVVEYVIIHSQPQIQYQQSYQSQQTYSCIPYPQTYPCCFY